MGSRFFCAIVLNNDTMGYIYNEVKSMNVTVNRVGSGGVQALSSFLSEEMNNIIANNSGEDIFFFFLIVLVAVIIFLGLYILLCTAILKLSKSIFKRIEKKNGESITIQFLQKAVSVVLILIFVVIPLGGKTFAKSLLGSTAVVAAVVGLAANEVIKDMFAGLEISIYKPFELGSRIMLDDGRAGIVEKLTLRHVVLKMIDTTRVIIPNSKANEAIIVNYSYAEEVPKSFDVRYEIGYTANIDKAKEIIRKTICECPLTLNEDKYDEDNPNSKMVYLLDIKDSSLTLGATVYYSFEYRTEVIKDEVNTRVFKALADGGIEVPYNYMNVIIQN